MLIAHLPAGYILARFLKFKKPDIPLWPSLLGSVAPDFDMLWFHLVDNSVNHHKLWPHIPFFWLCVLGAIAMLSVLMGRRNWLVTCLLFGAGIVLHLILDTLFAPLWWFYPFSDTPIEFFQIPAIQSHWVLSFLFHWSFLVELAILGFAAWLWFTRTQHHD